MSIVVYLDRCVLLNERLFSILSTSPISTNIYSWGRRFLATNLGKLNDIESFPRYAVATEIEDAWGSMSECAYRSIEQPEQLCGVEQLSLPVFKKQFMSHCKAPCTCKRFKVPQITNHYDQRPPPKRDTMAKYNRKTPKEMEFPGIPQFLMDLPSKGECDLCHQV